ncbi:hypothetical protein [Neobacillus sp. DY30]|uniref:hypothetical protein n=1 Tax=Neobacillus sp. DY30 TaxID=3047871 RepID=UPI0024C0E728|nr:hypothetical protein [Neobacillus sp. DY30]WHX99491.1 hypothetical protein QNH29_23335 [Neobacillus sp. DY30]
MGKNQQLVKLFVVLFFSTAFIFSSSHFGLQAFGKLANVDGKFADGTTVGPVDLTGKSESEAISLLEESFVNWVNNTKIELQYSERTVPFNLSLFDFDATQTVLSIQKGQSNTAFISVDQLEVEEQIKILFPEIDSEEIAIDKLTNHLNQTSSQFVTGNIQIYLNNEFVLNKTSQEVKLSEATISLTETPNDLPAIITAYPEIQVGEEGAFSLLEFAKQKGLENSASLNILATGIYQAVLPTNFSINSRNISVALPNYAQLGFEAKVNFAEGVDLVIVNPNKVKYSFTLHLENNILKIALKGDRLLNSYKISKKDEQVLKPKTIIQYSPLITPGQISVQSEGTNGKIVKVFRDIYQGNQLLNSELMAEDYYPPVYRVEIHGLAGGAAATGQTSTTTSTTGTNPTGSQTQTPSTSVTTQQQSDDLWGKPNEQPK